MIIAYIFGSISLAFSFAIVGLLINTAIRKAAFYRHLSNFNFIASEKANRYLGVLYFRHILKTTFWRHFNPTLKIIGRPDKEGLQSLRNEMTYAEISHLIAFVFVLPLLVCIKLYDFYKDAFWSLLIANILFHIYPALVQQYNKRRLDILLKRF